MNYTVCMYLHVHREQCSVECTVLVHCTLYNVNIDDKSKHQEGQSICCGGSLFGNVMAHWLVMCGSSLDMEM